MLDSESHDEDHDSTLHDQTISSYDDGDDTGTGNEELGEMKRKRKQSSTGLPASCRFGISETGEGGTINQDRGMEPENNNDQVAGLASPSSTISTRHPSEPTICNLVLGMIFGNFRGSTEAIGDMTEHTTQLRRDTARCLVTEECTGTPVYSLDNRAVDFQRQDRHIVQDLKDILLTDPLMASIKGRVHQICLDHFWFNSVYWDTKLGSAFFTKSLPKLWTLLLPTGAIYIGLSVHLLLHVLENELQLKHYFVLGLVHRDDVEEIDLVRGSHLIDDSLYACPAKFGNKDQKPESAFGVTLAQLKQTCPGTSCTAERVDQLLKLTGDRDPAEFGFIKLVKRAE